MSAIVHPVGRKMTEEEYRAVPALSYSSMKDLAVSPLRFWYMHINPNRPVVEPSREMTVGSALHCLVLEPNKFEHRYACEFAPPAYCLNTIEDLRGWLTEHGHRPKGTRKPEIVAQVHAIDPNVPVVEVLREFHTIENEGKTLLSKDDWDRVHRMAKALMDEPKVQELLSQIEPEVPMFATDEETGVPLKCRMDGKGPNFILDLKTFSVKRSNKSIDQAVADAIWNERYHHQAYLYALIERMNRDGGNESKSLEFVMPFVESEEPHEVRIRVLRPLTLGEVSMYWEQARTEVRRLLELFAKCHERFGDSPWRYEAKAHPLMDEELKALPWA